MPSVLDLEDPEPVAPKESEASSEGLRFALEMDNQQPKVPLNDEDEMPTSISFCSTKFDQSRAVSLVVESDMSYQDDLAVSTPTLPIAISRSFHKRSSESMQSLESSKSLPLVPEVELRAVSVKVIMMGLCSLWKSAAPSDEPQQLWREADDYDAFLSHSWRSGRWGKLLALCLKFNGTFALAVGFLWGVASMVLLRLSVIPRPGFWPTEPETVRGVPYKMELHFWSNITGTVLTLGALFFGHHITSPFMAPKKLFLDKVCIDQGDVGKKRAGIRSLPAFLKLTNELVILWSPEYFTRLWCVLELASWIYLERDRIYFAPLASANMIFSIFIVAAPGCVVYKALKMLSPQWYLVAVICVLPFSVIACHMLRHLVRERLALNCQLKEFSCEKAECFSQEDREQILSTIDEWFAPPKGEKRSAREIFDERVRTTTRKTLQRCIGSASQLHYSWAMITALPFFWQSCDHFVGIHEQPLEDQLRRLLDVFIRAACWTPLLAWFIFFISRHLSNKSRCAAVDCLKSVFGGAIWWMVFSSSHVFLNNLVHTGSHYLQLSTLVALAVLTWVFFPKNAKPMGSECTSRFERTDGSDSV